MSAPEPGVLELARLKEGFPGVSPVLGAAHYEACLVCMDEQKHASDILMSVKGDTNSQFRLQWKEDVTPQMRRSWADLENVTEWAACGIAFLVVEALTSYTILRQSERGTGVDYWIGEHKDRFFQEKARLEISGIHRAETESIIRVRMTEKWKQVRKSSDSKLPVYILVIEFSRPLAYMEHA